MTAKADQEIDISFSGELCPSLILQDPRILFIVDVSGSMADQQDTFFGIPVGPVTPGADHFQDGSCGRYEAIKSILEKTKSGEATQTGRAGLVLFGSGIHENSLEFSSLDDFEAQISPESICIGDNGTNYEQAFLTAKEWLDAEQGMLKLAYFISDGIPTEINNGFAPNQAEINQTSINAGKALTELGNTKLFQVFLGEASPENLEVMEGIAGSDAQNSIKDVANVSDLAKVLTDFSIVEINQDNLMIKVDQSAPLTLSRFEEVASGSSTKWEWAAESLLIPGDLEQLELSIELLSEHIEPISKDITISITRD